MRSGIQENKYIQSVLDPGSRSALLHLAGMTPLDTAVSAGNDVKESGNDSYCNMLCEPILSEDSNNINQVKTKSKSVIPAQAGIQ